MDLKQIRQQLAKNNLKATRPRQAILEALAQASGWVTAKSLFDKLSGQEANIDFSTICRNLELLSSIGILCRVDRDSNGIFAYSLSEMDEHHHHLICRSCGKISPMEFCPLQQLNSTQTAGYSELECRFEIYGCCRDCQGKQGK
ncbi:MAG: Fur family transcriptional regulator [Syntrophomonas sp.]|uniref:Fur family transcriptional regulator n=1 Tax=Syntrophomonas sp. TaxID=2053627 RepID=UPI002626BA52|nr:Fur family transcriptional regulator [Syntrophomonas sp.]MDD2510932.1 Fur family transcriptional regulator [Syntrophomonas sp.]MDD3879690.1 Fur family transcriptional regulator [Syntrophomonas sp.]MDD4626896.1 Fur family transcriptional regulator [Syntrophomonas sp.]